MTRLEKRAVLIVDDEPLIAIDLAARCEAEGATAMIAASVSAALAIAARHRIDAVILEHKLQQEDCNELCERLSRREIPFLTTQVGATQLEPVVSD